MAMISRVGYGQVEPNHLNAQRTGELYDQLPCAPSIKQLENGQFAKYDMANEEVNFTGEGEWLLVFNEVKLYDDWRESYKDFAMIEKNYTPGHYNSYVTETTTDAEGNEVLKVKTDEEGNPVTEPAWVYHERENVGPLKGYMTPRLFKTHIHDVFTTNCINQAGARGVETEGEDIEVGDLLHINDKGFLSKDGKSLMTWKVARVWTMPDGQPAVKLYRIK